MLVAMSTRKLLATTLQAVLAFAALATFALSQTRPKPPKSVRLYVFDNGVIKGLDPATFHFKKEEIATADMVVCSYLIVHPKGTLMWDTGAIPGLCLTWPPGRAAPVPCSSLQTGHRPLPRKSPAVPPVWLEPAAARSGAYSDKTFTG